MCCFNYSFFRNHITLNCFLAELAKELATELAELAAELATELATELDELATELATELAELATELDELKTELAFLVRFPVQNIIKWLLNLLLNLMNLHFQ